MGVDGGFYVSAFLGGVGVGDKFGIGIALWAVECIVVNLVDGFYGRQGLQGAECVGLDAFLRAVHRNADRGA